MQHFHLLIIFVSGLLIAFPIVRAQHHFLYSMLLTMVEYSAYWMSNLPPQNDGYVKLVVHIHLVHYLQSKN